jgi:CTP synthase (UTP-ammonia lyase)
MTEAYDYLKRPASAGRQVGKIFDELSMFHEVQTRLFTAINKCETAEAFDIYMEALKALSKVNHKPPTGKWVDGTDEDGGEIRVWQNADGTLIPGRIGLRKSAY